MYTAIFWLTGPTNRSQPIANLFNFYIFCPIWTKFGMWTTIGQKTTYNKFKIATATIWLTTTTKTAAPATGVGGVRGSRSRGIEGPHHHPQDFTIFSLRREPPLLVLKKFHISITVRGPSLTNNWCLPFVRLPWDGGRVSTDMRLFLLTYLID